MNLATVCLKTLRRLKKRSAARTCTVLLALVTVFVIAGVSEAFIAPSASPPPPAIGGSALSKIDGHGRGYDARLVPRGGSSSGGGGGDGCLSMSADGGANQGRRRRRRHARDDAVERSQRIRLWSCVVIDRTSNTNRHKHTRSIVRAVSDRVASKTCFRVKKRDSDASYDVRTLLG